MITPASLVNIHHHTQLQTAYVCFVMRTFKTYPLNNFQTCNTALLTIVTILYITYPWLYFIAGSWYLLTTSPISPTPHTPPLANINLSIYLWIWRFVLFLDSTYKWAHMAFVSLSLTYFTSQNATNVHPYCRKWQEFILFYAEQHSSAISIYLYTI